MPTVAAWCSEVLFGTRLNILLPFAPTAVVVQASGGSQAAVFAFALLGLCPLAERLGWATEQLAEHVGPVAGGLLNATFGNATELIVTVLAIRSGLLRVVQLSLLGSVLSNLLLVLGCAFFCGGLVHRAQRYSRDAVAANSTLLILGAVALLLPALLHLADSADASYDLTAADCLTLSRVSSVIMLLLYGAFVHSQLSASAGHDGGYDDGSDDEYGLEYGGQGAADGGEGDGGDEFAGGKHGSMLVLALLTGAIALLSDSLVSTIEGAASTLRLPTAFVSTILLPIVGNAAEHASAVLFAVRNKMDLAINVAVGSATQITLLGFPFAVVVAWQQGQPLSLDLQPFETGVFIICVVGTALIIGDGRANWLKGAALVACYAIVAASFLFHSEPALARAAGGDAVRTRNS